MRTIQTYEAMVLKHWEALSSQGWHNIDAAAKHYHENPGKLDRDLAAYTRASRHRNPEANRSGVDDRERFSDRLRETSKARHHIQILAIEGHSIESIQELTREGCERVTGGAGVWSESTIRRQASVPIGETPPPVDYSHVLTGRMQ